MGIMPCISRRIFPASRSVVMNWKLIGSAIGAVVVIGFVIYSLFGSGEDSAMSGRTGSRRNSSGASTPSPPPATSPKAAAPALAATGAPPAGAKPASPMPVAAAPVAVAPVNAAPIDPGIAAPAAPVAKPISLALVPPPARQRGAVSQSEPDRVRHTLLRLARIQMAIDDYSRAN